MTTHQLFTFGYSGHRAADLAAWARERDALIVDIRFRPASRRPEWSGRRLAELLGNQYVHLPALGNKLYRGGEVRFVNMEVGLALLTPWLEQGRTVVLLCVCARAATCHRSVVADALAARGWPAMELVRRPNSCCETAFLWAHARTL